MKVGMIENKLTLSITVSLFFQNESSRTGLEKYYLWVCRSDASSNLAHLNETPNYLEFFVDETIYNLEKWNKMRVVCKRDEWSVIFSSFLVQAGISVMNISLAKETPGHSGISYPNNVSSQIKYQISISKQTGKHFLSFFEKLWD